jgi:hypothetical protein
VPSADRAMEPCVCRALACHLGDAAGASAWPRAYSSHSAVLTFRLIAAWTASAATLGHADARAPSPLRSTTVAGQDRGRVPCQW